MEQFRNFAKIPTAPPKVISTGAADSLADRFLQLAHKHHQLRLQSLILKSEVEFAIDHLRTMSCDDDEGMKMVVNRLKEAIQKIEVEDLTDRSAIESDATRA